MQRRDLKLIAFGLLALLAALPALAFDVSEATVNQVIAAKLAEKRFDDLQLSATHVTLLEGEATFCTDARPKIYPRDISFCAGLTPKWRQDTASLVASRMSLLSLSVRGIDPQQIEVVRLVLNQGILPALEGVELYRADNALAKQISGVKIRPGRIELDMQ
jgi:hypothetical protein